jgi:hypothetical protein
MNLAIKGHLPYQAGARKPWRALLALLACACSGGQDETAVELDSLGSACERAGDAPTGTARVDGCAGEHLPSHDELFPDGPVDKFRSARWYGQRVGAGACYKDGTETACDFPSNTVMKLCPNWGNDVHCDPDGGGAQQVAYVIDVLGWDYFSAGLDGIADALDDFNAMGVQGVSWCTSAGCSGHTLFVGLRNFAATTFGEGGIGWNSTTTTAVANLPASGAYNAGAARVKNASIAHLDFTSIYNWAFGSAPKCAKPFSTATFRAFVRSVFTHELFHAYGFGHFAEQSSVMYPFTGCNPDTLGGGPRFIHQQYKTALDHYWIGGDVNITTHILTHTPF